MFKTYAMSVSKTWLVVSIGGGFTVVEESGDTLVLPGDVPFEEPRDLPLAVALGCVPGE
jgi:hypothetical protein